MDPSSSTNEHIEQHILNCVGRVYPGTPCTCCQRKRLPDR
jgi:hypothetical protein